MRKSRCSRAKFVFETAASPAAKVTDPDLPTGRTNRTRAGFPFLGPVCVILLALAHQPFHACGQNPTPQPDAVRAVVIDVQGRVEFQRTGTATWEPVRTLQVLQPEERVHTRENSFVTVRVGHQVPVRFGELTDFVFLPPVAPSEPARLNLRRGLLYFFSREKPARLRLDTPLCSTAIRGTEFVLEVQDTDRTILTLVEGEAEMSSPLGSVIVKSGEQAVAEAGKQPFVTVGISAINVIQWCLYYPAMLDLDELTLTAREQQSLNDSLAAYRAGDLRQALASLPAGYVPASVAERVYLAAVLLAVGEVEKAEQQLAFGDQQPGAPTDARLAAALRQMIAAVKNQPRGQKGQPELATEWLAESYSLQAQHAGTEPLKPALQAARAAVNKSPGFAFAWARVAELEFSFGRNKAATAALDKALAVAPRNAQAVALKGFLLAARNRTKEAIAVFDQAIALDGRLANAWLGRGLCRIREGRAAEGRTDLLTAAAVEPQRALLRSYLGKAYSDASDGVRAEHELDLAKKLDPQDPTPWLYSALRLHEENRANEAIRALEKSQELNNSRSLYRSGLLLDQDRAVRSANLGRLYAEAGLDDVAVREASRAVTADYGNYSAHLFLANSYAQLRRAGRQDLRFETANLSEYFVASLLGPADGRLLAQPVSQQEYTCLFERDTLRLSTSTEYLSRGAWNQTAVQYGTLGNSSYAVEGEYRSDPGESANRNVEYYHLSVKFKQMLSPQDGLYVEVGDEWRENGYLGRLYDPNQALAFPDFRAREKMEPYVLAGFDHQWNERHRTLFLAEHFNNSFVQHSPHSGTYLLALDPFSDPPVDYLVTTDLTQQYQARTTIDSFELQHLVRTERLQTIAGIRYQYGTERLSNLQTIETFNAPDLQMYFGNAGTVVTNQSMRLHVERLSPYLYEYWQVADPLWLIGGVSYDNQRLPRNDFFAPLSTEEQTRHQLSPKVGAVWTPTPRSAVRATYTQSLGGDLEQSTRLEPSQLAGFVQAYRNLFPESLVGSVPGARMETADLSLEHRFSTGTYVALGGEWLHSTVTYDVGAFYREDMVQEGPIRQLEERLRFQEHSLNFSLHQLLGDWFNVGVEYRVADSRVYKKFPAIDPSLGPLDGVWLYYDGTTSRAVLHTVNLSAGFQHPCGFFTRVDGTWRSQSPRGDALYSPSENLRVGDLPGDSFWQVNLLAGYRFPRRCAEITVGLLNATGQDYRLYPVNLYPDLSRERAFFARLQLNF